MYHFYIRTMHLDIFKVFYSPMNAQVIVLKTILNFTLKYEGHLESKERFAIKKYLLIIGKKKNMPVLSHTLTYFST